MASLYIHNASGVNLIVQFPNQVNGRMYAYTYAQEMEEKAYSLFPEDRWGSAWPTEDYRKPPTDPARMGVDPFDKPIPAEGVILFAISHLQVILAPLDFKPTSYRILAYVSPDDAVEMLLHRNPFSVCSDDPAVITPRKDPYYFTSVAEASDGSEVLRWRKAYWGNRGKAF
jgi:hypothetical protein